MQNTAHQSEEFNVTFWVTFSTELHIEKMQTEISAIM